MLIQRHLLVVRLQMTEAGDNRSSKH